MSRVAFAGDDLKRGAWTAEEDEKLRAYVVSHGTGHWRSVGRKAGLQRCGKSCRLRWTNYLRPNIRHGSFTPYEEDLIVKLHSSLGSRWSLIAAKMPGRTDNDIKNHWNTRLKKKLCNMGIDPVTHKPISELLRDIAGSMDGSAGYNTNIAAGEEAARRCFSDNLLRKAVRDYSRTSSASAGPSKYDTVSRGTDINFHSSQQLKQSVADHCDASGIAHSSFIQKEADQHLHSSWDHSISSTSNCMGSHHNSCSEVDDVNLSRSSSRSPSGSMQSLVNSPSRSKNMGFQVVINATDHQTSCQEAASSGSQLDIITNHHHADHTSPGTPAFLQHLATAPPASSKENPTNNLELSFKSSSDHHHAHLMKELHEISRQFFPAAAVSHGKDPSSRTTRSTTSQVTRPSVHFLSDHADHLPCWQTTSMNAAAAAGTTTIRAASLVDDELAAAVIPCSNKLLHVPMTSRFSTESNLQLHIKQQQAFNFSHTITSNMELMKTRSGHILMPDQQLQDDHGVQNSSMSTRQYYNQIINSGLNFNQQFLQTSDLELPAGAYLSLREPFSSNYNNNAAAAAAGSDIVINSSGCPAAAAAQAPRVLLSSLAAAAESPLSSSFRSTGPAAAATLISNFSTGPGAPATPMATTTLSGNLMRLGHHYDHQTQASRVQVLWDFQE